MAIHLCKYTENFKNQIINSKSQNLFKKNRTPSKMEATANIVDGDISDRFLQIDLKRLSDVSLSPSASSLNRSVLAVHNTIT